MGETDAFGNIQIRRGIVGQELAETLRHEGVHRFFSPRRGPFLDFRARKGMQAYLHSHLIGYLEEAIAETVGTRSLRRGLAFPLQGDYGLSRTRIILEGVGYATIVAGASYGTYKLANGGQ